MDAILQWHADLIAFGALGLLALAWVAFRTSRRARLGLPVWVIVGAVGIIAGTMALAEFAGRRERSRLVEMVSGIAPTYAMEMHRHGLATISPATRLDDPTYLELIRCQVEWLRINPAVADVYSFAQRPDGEVVLLVDSETDYDRDGILEGEKESRTPIAEEYDAPPSLLAAFDGNPIFDANPQVDRWGVWVSAYEPVRDEAGHVYAVVGVDFPAARWVASILATRTVVLMIGGTVLGILLASASVTRVLAAEVVSRRDAEAQARASESRLRTIVESEPECVMVIDASGAIVEINPAGLAMCGVPGDRVVGRPLTDFVEPAHAQAVRQHHAGVLTGGRAVIEFELVGADGAHRRLWMEMHSVPLGDPGTPARSILCVARDVTARKLAEAEKQALQDQLVRASRAAGMAEIATGVLHNVGNVLNSVNVSGALIAERLKASKVPALAKAITLLGEHRADLTGFVSHDERGRHVLDFLAKSAEHAERDREQCQRELASLLDGIEHIKQIVRAQQSCAAAKPVVELASAAQVMDDALAMNLVAVERHGITIAKAYEDLAPVPLDKHGVLQILVNLISNAKKATSTSTTAERRVDLRVRQRDAQVIFEVADNGVGIPSDGITSIFRHGYSTWNDGHGFGLHSSANAAAAMGGSLTAASPGPNQGATFTLTIPIADAARRAA